ncbi:MAG TPA: ferredoxin [Opitutales bacterium]|nr:ferredoxin [Opitutales bacterium]
MSFISIIHKGCECIGCGLCIESAPDYWFMNSAGEAELRNIQRSHGKFEYGEAFAQDRSRLESVAEGCPVNIIRIE